MPKIRRKRKIYSLTPKIISRISNKNLNTRIKLRTNVFYYIRIKIRNNGVK